MSTDLHNELKLVIQKSLNNWDRSKSNGLKGSLSIKKDINNPTKDLPNTKPNDFSVYVYTVPRLLGQKINITIDGPSNGNEALSAEEAAGIIDYCIPILGKQKKFLLNVRFHSKHYNVLSESALGIQAKFTSKDLDFGVNSKLPEAEYLKKIEETIYRYAVWSMCVDARFTNKNKDSSFISDKILCHVTNKSQKQSLTDEIMDCFSQNHNLLESAGVLYFINRDFLRNNMPEYDRLFENLAAQKIDYEYFPPTLTYTDEVFSGVRMATKPVKNVDSIQNRPAQQSLPEEPGGNGQRTLPDYFYRENKPAEVKKTNTLGLDLNAGPLTRIDGNLIYSSGNLVGKIDGNRIYIGNQLVILDGNLIYMNGDLVGKIDGNLIYMNGNLVGKIDGNIIYGR